MGVFLFVAVCLVWLVAFFVVVEYLQAGFSGAGPLKLLVSAELSIMQALTQACAARVMSRARRRF